MNAKIPLMFLVLSYAGCIDQPGQEQREPADLPSTTEAPSPELAPTGVPRQFSLNECYLTSTSFLWIGDSGPGTYPTGWKPSTDDGVVATSDIVEIISCQRLGWGIFERPITLLLESHDKFVAPQACRGIGSNWILHRIWTDDASLAEFLASNFGISVGIVSFTHAFENSTELVRLTWSWETPDGHASDLTTVVTAPAPQDLPLKLDRRYFVDRGTGITVLDVNYTAEVPTSPEQFAVGYFDQIMLHASTGVSAFAGPADYWTRVNAQGSISEFGDYLCAAEV